MAPVPAAAASAWLALALALVASASEPAPLQVAFTTDFPAHFGTCIPVCGAQGPDGPWQAVILKAGVKGTNLAFYPTLDDQVMIAGSHYFPSKSTTANTSTWINYVNANGTTTNISTYYEFFGLESLDQGMITTVQVNVTYTDGNAVPQRLPNGSIFLPPVGNFGLGPSFPDHSASPLSHLQSQGSIPSQFFGLHMGSGPLNLSGSLILGGYEQNRALGRVAVSKSVSDVGFYLVDMLLGVEQGSSPFSNNTTLTKDGSKSLWNTTWGREAESNTTHYNGPKGSASITIDPTYPYIYLASKACKALTNYIPITWRSDIKYYIWNVNDPLYHRLVLSPAYLAFIFADQDAQNLTIKVPFALLNLTLEPPIVPAPTPYFPCQPPQKDGGWMLGRAFLQAAFLGLKSNPDGSLTSFLAQAPGPGLEESIIHPFKPNDTTISSNPADSFAKTWQAHWTAIPEETEKQPDPATQSSRSNMSGGTVAGIAVGSITGVLIIMAAMMLLWRRHRQRAAKDKKSKQELDGREQHEAAGSSHPPQELSDETQRLEMQGCMVPTELPAEEAMSPS